MSEVEDKDLEKLAKLTKCDIKAIHAQKAEVRCQLFYVDIIT